MDKSGSINRAIILLLCLLAILGVLTWFVPHVIAIHYQSISGRIIADVISTNKLNMDFSLLCANKHSISAVTSDDVDKALHYLDLAARYSPNLAHTYLLEGRAYCLINDFDQAIDSFKRYIKRAPDNPIGHLELGFAYEGIDDLLSAAREWEGIPFIFNDFLNNGTDALRNKNTHGAIIWYKRATIVAPNVAAGWVQLAKAYTDSTDFGNALNTIETAWGIDPEMSATQYAQILDSEGIYQSSEFILRKALSQYPNSQHRFEWWQSLGKEFTNQKKWDEAINAYQEAIIEFPNSAELLVALGWTLYERGDDPALAREKFEAAIQFDPTSGYVYYSFGQLLYKEGKAAEAEPLLQKAVELEPANMWYRVIWGDITQNAGDLNKAEQIFQKLVQDYPKYDRGYLELAQVYLLLDRLEDAKRTIEQALSLAPAPDQWYYLRAANIYEKAGEKGKALEYFHQALTIDPSNGFAKEGIKRLDN